MKNLGPKSSDKQTKPQDIVTRYDLTSVNFLLVNWGKNSKYT